jgi:hypothetical protein
MVSFAGQFGSGKEAKVRISNAVVTLVSILACATDASAHSRRYRPVPPVELPPTEGRGCYFERGIEYCGSYCYWEVNGKRYCQQRLRDAHSQAPVDLYYSDGSPVLK